jgi:hypothetical protein
MNVYIHYNEHSLSYLTNELSERRTARIARRRAMLDIILLPKKRQCRGGRVGQSIGEVDAENCGHSCIMSAYAPRGSINIKCVEPQPAFVNRV